VEISCALSSTVVVHIFIFRFMCHYTISTPPLIFLTLLLLVFCFGMRALPALSEVSALQFLLVYYVVVRHTIVL
jgi:hypothetical protein